MDLGIAGKTALVCAASKGLGRGCALALAKNGVRLFITARTASTLEAAAREIAAATGAEVTRCLATSPRRRGARRRSPPVPSPTSWSTMRAARRPATSANGTRTTG